MTSLADYIGAEDFVTIFGLRRSGDTGSTETRDCVASHVANIVLSIWLEIMRIHLTLRPDHLNPIAGPSSVISASGSASSPLVQLGGELVIIELQGELSHEGEKENGVIGVLGLDRPVG